MHKLIICLACIAAPGLAQEGSETSIRIGVRDDAPPFVSIDPDSRAFIGYLYDVCTTAVTRAGYQFTEHPVDATDRSAFLTLGQGRFDLLCDPTTITLARMANFGPLGPKTAAQVGNGNAVDRPTELDFSQIIFIANGAYAERRISPTETWRYQTGELARARSETSDGRSDFGSCAGLFAEIEAFGERPEGTGDKESEPQPWRLSDHIVFRRTPTDELNASTDNPQAEIRGFVIGTTIWEAATRQPTARGARPFACWLPSHTDAARAFCEGRLDRYYGDLDVVRASIRRHAERTGVECPFREPDQESFTFEPYAFAISARLIEFPERFRCAIYSMFTDGTMESLYRGHFGVEKTNFLRALFAINSIPAGRGLDSAGGTGLCGVTR